MRDGHTDRAPDTGTTLDRVLVVGAGHAGCALAAALRSSGFTGAIHLVAGESVLPYQRPPLSKTCLTQSDVPPPLMRPVEWYEEQDIDLVLGDRVVSLDPEAGTAVLESGRVLPFDHAVLATGSTNQVLPLLVDDPAVHSLRTVEDLRRLRAALPDARQVCVVGGGLIGLEVATSVGGPQRAVVVVEAAERPLARVLTPITGAALVRLHRDRGVEIRCSAAVDSVRRDDSGRLTGLTLTDGSTVPCDIVVVGIGALPDVALAVAAGLEVGSGVHVDERLLTSHPRVSAIGDIAAVAAPDGRRRRSESIPGATDQARYVARRLMGGDERFAATPWAWSDQAGTKVQIVGALECVDECAVYASPDRPGAFTVWHFHAGQLIGGESVGDPRGHVALRSRLQPGGPTTTTADLPTEQLVWRGSPDGGVSLLPTGSTPEETR